MTQGTLPRRSAWLLVLLAGAACPSDSPSDTGIRLVVMDGQIREPEDECAGAGPYLYVHAQAGYTIQDRSGEVVAEGRLPPGRAVEADPSIDWRVPRVPTFCVMGLEVEDLGPGSYRLSIADGPPLAFRLPEDLDEEGLVTLTIS